jgi:ubiquinone/menaquinone biosynthesis C-methylase UbiE
MPEFTTRTGVRRTISRGLGRAERTLVGARRRFDEQSGTAGSGLASEPATPPPIAGRYGRLWEPPAEGEAMSLILNTSDSEEFEAAGREEAERLSKFFGPTSTVVDLGCGIGRVARYVAPGCATLWAVDASDRMLQLASHHMSDQSNVQYVTCVDTAFPAVPSASVDLAYALLVLQHLEREDAFLLLEELRRVIRPGGVAVVTYPNLLSDVYLASFLDYVRQGQVTNPARARIYTPQEVERLVPAAGFEIIDLDVGVEIRVVCRPAG